MSITCKTSVQCLMDRMLIKRDQTIAGWNMKAESPIHDRALLVTLLHLEEFYTLPLEGDITQYIPFTLHILRHCYTNTAFMITKAVTSLHMSAYLKFEIYIF